MGDGAGALAGVRVIDLTRILAGPYCTQMLGDHGADVIKVEALGGDETRRWGPPFSADGTSAYFRGVNRNKRSLALDLSKDGGRVVLLRLLEKADVLLENFKAGQMEKWGLGYEPSLRSRFPRLIYGQITGYGVEGPLAGRPGFDAVAQVMSGLASINGPVQGSPVRVGTPISDLATAFYATNGILMALYERVRSDLGQKVDVSLLDCSVSLLHPHAANYFMTGEAPTRIGNAHPNIAPYEMFETANGFIFVAAGTNEQFERLVTYLGKPKLAADPRFLDNATRKANEESLMAELSPLFVKKDATLLAEELLMDGVPAGAVLEVPQVLDHPQVRARGMVLEDGEYQGIGVPVKMGRTPGYPRMSPPKLGEHVNDILLEAGFDEAEIESLVRTSTVGDMVFSGRAPEQ